MNALILLDKAASGIAVVAPADSQCPVVFLVLVVALAIPMVVV